MNDPPADFSRQVTSLRKARRGTIVSIALSLAVAGIGATRFVEQRGGVRPIVSKTDAATMNAGQAKPAAGELLQDLPADEPAAVVLASFSPIDIAHETKPSIAKRNVIWMEVTAYCACTQCCGPNAVGLTASGKDVSYNESRFVAADTDVLPFGTRLSVPGYAGDQAVEVIDRGGAIKGNRLDVFFPTHEEATQWGRQWVAVTVNR